VRLARSTLKIEPEQLGERDARAVVVRVLHVQSSPTAFLASMRHT
jgi:hypothetical protein